MKAEIDRIINLYNKLDEIEIENTKTITDAGFKDQDDYDFIKSINETFDNFMQYIEEWDGLEERKPTILRTFVLIKLLKKENIDV